MHWRHHQRERVSEAEVHTSHIWFTICFGRPGKQEIQVQSIIKILTVFLEGAFSLFFLFFLFSFLCNLNLSRFMTCMYVSVCLCSYRRKACEVCCPGLCTLQKTLCLPLPPLGNVISRTGSTSYHILGAHTASEESINLTTRAQDQMWKSRLIWTLPRSYHSNLFLIVSVQGWKTSFPDHFNGFLSPLSLPLVSEA